MIKVINTLITLLLLSAFLGCGGSKEELVMENETPESMLLKSKQAYNAGKYDESMKLARLLLDHFPTSDLHIDAQLIIANSYGGKEEYEEICFSVDSERQFLKSTEYLNDLQDHYLKVTGNEL